MRVQCSPAPTLLPTSGSQMSRSSTLDRRPTCGVRTMVGESSLRKCQTGQDAGRRRRGSISFQVSTALRTSEEFGTQLHTKDSAPSSNAVMSAKGGTNAIEALELGQAKQLLACVLACLLVCLLACLSLGTGFLRVVLNNLPTVRLFAPARRAAHALWGKRLIPSG